MGQLEHVAGLAVRVFDAEDFAEGHLLQGQADFGFLGKLAEGGLRIADQPIQLQIATATQRLVAGDGEVGAGLLFELDERGAVQLDLEAEDVDVKTPG